MKKNILLTLIALSCAMYCKAYNFKSGNLYYKIISDSTVEVCPKERTDIGIPNAYGGLTSVSIPSSVTYRNKKYTVTWIGVGAFHNCPYLTSVTIPNSVTEIWGYAFGNCPRLTSIVVEQGNKVYDSRDDCNAIIETATNTLTHGCSGTIIPNSVTSIGLDAFYEYTGSTPITIPNSVTSIKNYAFFGSTLASITIPNSVTSIEAYAFYGCTNLTSITIPESVTSIGVDAFSGCSKLSSVVWNAKKCNARGAFSEDSIVSFVFGNEVEEIPNYLCYGIKKLTSVTISNSVTSIGEKAFYGCTSLTSIAIPNSVTSIGEEAFCGCTSLTSVTIPNSVTTIKRSAFCGSGLTSVTIPSSVTNIEYYAFAGCHKLSTVVWNAKKCNALGGVVFAGSSIESVVFGDEVEEIPHSLFYDMKKLTSVTIGNSVTSIEDYAFYGCTGLMQTNYTGDIAGWCAISFASYYTNPIYYSHDLYINGTKIIDLIIPDSVTSIEKYAFYGCSSLASVTIGNSITSIGEGAFYGCTNLSSVIWNAKAYPDCFDNTPFYSRNMDIRDQITSFVFGDKVERIPQMLCYGMKNLTSVTIPESVTSIGGGAFSDCTGLTSVNIPNSVTSIGGNAFSGCTGLTSVNIPNSVTSIGGGAFSGCTGLTSVNIPNSVTSIGDAAFYKCSNLTSVTISEGVTVVDENAFRGTGISTIFIPNSVTTIGKWAFLGCPNLTYAHIGNGIETIWQESFECPNIDSIRIEAKVPPEVKYTYWQNSILGDSLNVPVYVPCGSKDAYQKAEGWRTLTHIIEPASVYTIDVFSANTAIGTASITQSISACNDEAIITATPNNSSRYHFVQWNDGNTDNPRTVIVTQDTTFTAEFAINQYTITASGDHGTVEGTGTYDYNTKVYLTAVPDKGYHFVKWDNGKTYNPYYIYVRSDTTLTAEFAPNQYTITTYAQNGNVSGAGTYDYGTTATLMATANEHYHFTQWSDGNTDNPRTVAVEDNATYTAEFKPDSYTIIVSAGEHGSVNGGGTYDYGTTATLTATADEHYHFTQWSDGNTDNPRTVSVVGDATYTAEFAIDRHSITVIYDTQQGVVTGAGMYDYGTQVTLTATASKGYEFAQWSNGVTDNPYLLTATADLTLEAQFVPATAVENVSADGDTPQKIIRDGQVYILRNGKTYTTTGIEVK